MKYCFGLLVFISLLFLPVKDLISQSVTTPKDAVAYITLNGQKVGNDQRNINYKTSFFIKHYSLDSISMQKNTTTVLASKYAFKEFKMIEANNASEKGVKDMMVIIDVSAATIDELTEKIKFLFTELGVQKVDYNHKLYLLKEFKF